MRPFLRWRSNGRLTQASVTAQGVIGRCCPHANGVVYEGHFQSSPYPPSADKLYFSTGS
jgi:hypothetical protein